MSSLKANGHGVNNHSHQETELKPTLKPFPHYSVTPTFGEIFDEKLQLRDVIDDEALLKDLAVTISERGFVAFKSQCDLPLKTIDTLVHRLGLATGKPLTSTTHIHPISQAEFNEDGTKKTPLGQQVTLEADSRGAILSPPPEAGESQYGSNNWHSDISFEPVSSDYTCLRMVVLPPSGGDTIFASAYEAYDRLSERIRSFLEKCTALHEGEFFNQQAAKYGFSLYTDERGAPELRGDVLKAIHPVIRTNPVTGWKVLYVNRSFTTRIMELKRDESDALLNFLFRLVADNPNLQARYTWSLNDTVIWDNRAVLHAPIFDYEGMKRCGDRAVGLAERPYFDPQSISRRQALAKKPSIQHSNHSQTL